MWDTAGNLNTVLCCNNANSSLTTGVKKENMNKRIGSVQPQLLSGKREVLGNPALLDDKRLAARIDVNQDGNVAFVTPTDNYGCSDKWHSDDATKLTGIPSLLNIQHLFK